MKNTQKAIQNAGKALLALRGLELEKRKVLERFHEALGDGLHGHTSWSFQDYGKDSHGAVQFEIPLALYLQIYPEATPQISAYTDEAKGEVGVSMQYPFTSCGWALEPKDGKPGIAIHVYARTVSVQTKALKVSEPAVAVA